MTPTAKVSIRYRLYGLAFILVSLLLTVTWLTYNQVSRVTESSQLLADQTSVFLSIRTIHQKGRLFEQEYLNAVLSQDVTQFRSLKQQYEEITTDLEVLIQNANDEWQRTTFGEILGAFDDAFDDGQRLFELSRNNTEVSIKSVEYSLTKVQQSLTSLDEFYESNAQDLQELLSETQQELQQPQQEIFQSNLLNILLPFLLCYLIIRSITRPLRDLVYFASQVSQGRWDMNDLPPVRSDEIGFLTEAMNLLKNQIWKRHYFQKHLLDSTDHGILLFDQNFVIQELHSQSCWDLFGHEIQGKNVLEVLLYQSQRKSMSNQEVLYMIFDEPERFDALRTLLPTEITVHQRTIELQYMLLDYRPMHGELQVLVFLREVTKVRQNEALRDKYQRRNRVLVRAFNDLPAFSRSLQELHQTWLSIHELLATLSTQTELTELEKHIQKVAKFAKRYGFDLLLQEIEDLQKLFVYSQTGRETLEAQFPIVLIEQVLYLQKLSQHALKAIMPTLSKEEILRVPFHGKQVSIGLFLRKLSFAIQDISRQESTGVNLSLSGEALLVPYEEVAVVFEKMEVWMEQELFQKLAPLETRVMRGKPSVHEWSMDAFYEEQQLCWVWKMDSFFEEGDELKRSFLEQLDLTNIDASLEWNEYGSQIRIQWKF